MKRSTHAALVATTLIVTHILLDQLEKWAKRPPEQQNPPDFDQEFKH